MNSWCKHCARKDYCYTTTVRPKSFVPMVNSTCNTSPIVRIDFFKDSNNTPILLEFEMVNPGFFIGYMAEHDNDIHRIVSFVRRYCERNIRSK